MGNMYDCGNALELFVIPRLKGQRFWLNQGELAEQIGVRPALLSFAFIGVGCHLVWQILYPQARQMRRLS